MLVWSLALQSKLASNTVKHLGRQLLRGSLLQTELERQPRMTSGQPPSAHAGTAAHMGKNRAHSKAMGNSRQPGAAAAAAAAAADVCATEPSSSTGSEQHTALFRPPSRASSPATGGIKSAKRKVAEALLAAQYGGLAAGRVGTLAAHTAPHRGLTSHAYAAAAAPAAVDDSASDVSAQQDVGVYKDKRQRVALASAILRLGDDSATAAAAAWAGAAASSEAELKLQGPAAGRQLLHSQSTPQQQQLDASSTQQRRQSEAAAAAGGDVAGAKEVAVQAVSVEAAGAALLQQGQQQGSVHARSVQPPPVLVPACDPQCSHHLSQGWCHSQVRLPHVDWGCVLDADMAKAPSFRMAEGYERLHMPAGIQVLVVEHVQHIPAALVQLRCSMQDPVVAIDLEWRPEHGRGFTPVALVQLASSRLAVLIRTCKMGYRLPQPLRDFMADPQVHLLGFSWASSDESKMRSTFGVGAKDFGRFMDLQQVAHGLGYHQFGLARLTQQVLGLHMPKSKKVSMSNWEGVRLTQPQVKYAALDVLMAGQVFRALRLWHSSPSVCEVCHHNIGAPSSISTYPCGDCGKMFFNIKNYVHHCERAGHKAAYTECEGCGCARSLPGPAGSTAADAATAAGATAAAKAKQ